MFYKWLYIIAIVGILGACKKQTIKEYPLVIDSGYFPLDSGFWREFAITYIDIDADSEKFDTTHGYVKEEFTGWFIDAANDSSMRIERFKRDGLDQEWSSNGVWQACIKNNEAHQVEDNQRFLKILFPIKLNNSWNGDKYNRLDTLEQYQYEITAVNVPNSISDINFDSVLTVNQKDKSTQIDKIEDEERYAYGIGLISKKQINIKSEITDQPTVPIEDRVTKGTMYSQKIIAYGKK